MSTEWENENPGKRSQAGRSCEESWRFGENGGLWTIRDRFICHRILSEVMEIEKHEEVLEEKQPRELSWDLLGSEKSNFHAEVRPGQK